MNAKNTDAADFRIYVADLAAYYVARSVMLSRTRIGSRALWERRARNAFGPARSGKHRGRFGVRSALRI